MIEVRKLIYGIVAFIGTVLVFTAGFYLFSRGGLMTDDGLIAENPQMVLRDSEGLNIEYSGGGFQQGERLIYERYRLFDETGTYALVGAEGNINISAENATLFLKSPDGSEQEITSDNWFIPLRLYPPLEAGRHSLTFNLKTGETFQRDILINEAQKVDLQFLGLSKSEPKPILKVGEVPTPEQQVLLTELNFGNRDSRVVQAFGLKGQDLKKATSIYHVNPENIVKSINTPGFFADGYMWLDVWKISEIEHGEHLFFAKIDNTWYYAIARYPEDFDTIMK